MISSEDHSLSFYHFSHLWERLGEILANSSEPREALRQSLEFLFQELRAEGTALFLWQENPPSLHREYEIANQDYWQESWLNLGQGIAGWVAQNNHSAVIENPAEDEELKKMVDEEFCLPLRNLMAFPLTVNHQVLGIWEIINFPLNLLTYQAMFFAIAGEISLFLENIRLHRWTDDKIFRLTSLMEITNIINSTWELNRLLNLVMELAAKVMKAEISSLILVDEDIKELVYEVVIGEKGKELKKFRLKMEEGIAGWVAQKGQPLLIPDVSKDTSIPPRMIEKIDLHGKSILCAPLKMKERVIGVVEVINKLGGGTFTQEDLELFASLAQQIAIAIANARLYQKGIDAQRWTQELAIARNLQESILPKNFPQIKGCDIAAVTIPAEEIGGDFYDFIPFTTESVGIVIADVSGKSIPAALYTAMIRTLLRAEAREKLSPAEILFRINRYIIEDFQYRMFVTLVYAVLDVRLKRLIYVNAGHRFPIIVHKNKPQFLRSESIALGLSAEEKYTPRQVRLDKGDVMVFYTDGIIDAINRQQEIFGQERLLQLVEKYCSLSAQGLTDRIREELHNFTQGQPQFDDLTLLVLKLTES